MDIAKNFAQAQTQIKVWKRKGERVALIPTMGNLHQGHLNLVKEAKRLAHRTVVSIFVNPLQFSVGEDLEQYPRTPEQDKRQLEWLGTDLLFFPQGHEVYCRSPWNSTFVEVPRLSHILCGQQRINHFRGVVTVILRFFTSLQPDVAVFGKKDYQQCLVIRRMVDDFALPIDIVEVATVREKDGLAMSSRNCYLNAKERLQAPYLHQALCDVAERIQKGDRNFQAMTQWGKGFLQHAGFKPEYFEVLTQAELAQPGPSDNDLVCLAAAQLGAARLIDNISFGYDE